MKAVYMEFNFRLCASPGRLQKFVEHARRSVLSACPERLQQECISDEIESPLLLRQWRRLNADSTFPPPAAWEVGFGFHDPTGRLTSDRLEAMSTQALTDLRHVPTGEAVPWILTSATNTDTASRNEIVRRYRTLQQAHSYN
nr:hypothetical protein [Rhodococcus sp. (in: high G+C Gram-positive bacteria)]